ncbi:iron-containing redox enzyme family protein [Leucobacter denitrificans]|uniref:Iron-containing redox enzyme family protein n=1 Tax=Leucobacter denitrificans TaxID=683042 RepID=A0A7G9S2K9_9MICO|nr:iron-containing redox enzyme family protein [Leucobacter denitrificans]QNN62084.1 iron-containing redox enzyme family protein [Leucobacter denitrificans]
MRYAEPPFQARGPVSEQLLAALGAPTSESEETLAGFDERLAHALSHVNDILRDDDLQVSLLVLHGLHYGSVVDADEEWEWHPVMVAARVAIEREFERQLREVVPEVPLPKPEAEAVASALFELTKPTPGPSLARFIAKRATAEHVREYLVLRSVYTLKEADAQTWTIPRLNGRVKAALVEIQTDEYGGGREERMHSSIFAKAMREFGLDDTYAAHLDSVPALIIASFNMMSMFGLNRRLRGASAGHYAAYEMTSSLPNRMIGDGIRRLGFGEAVSDYFDEHVEADAVHEQIAGRDLAGGLAEQEPQLLADIVFGANASVCIDGWGAEEALEAWIADRSALRQPFAVGEQSHPADALEMEGAK